jgi:preprotein translocase subunit SecD
MRHKLPLFPLLMLAMLAVACAGSPAHPGPTSPTPTPPPLTSGIRVLLVPTIGTSTPSQAQLDTVRATLAQRLAAFGLKNARVSQLVPASQPALLVEVPHFGGDERGTLAILLETGRLAFWDTGLTAEYFGTTFDPTQFTPYNPGNQPWFTGNDLDASRISVGTDQSGLSRINFQMRGKAIARFSQFTASHVGEYLTLTLDGKVIASAVIVSQIDGPGAVSGNLAHQQVTALVSVLKYPPLPVAFQISSESTFTR